MFGAWLSKGNVTAQNVSDGQDNKATASVGITPVSPVEKKIKPLSVRQLLIPRVILASLNYAFLALVDICTRAIQPVFFSTPIALGGLGLPPHHIGKILSIYGILNGFLQIFYFAKTQARFGPKNVYLAGIASSLLVFVMFPVINNLARVAGINHWLVWLAVAFQVTVSIFINFSYGESFPRFVTVSPRSTVADTRFLRRLCLHLYHCGVAESRVSRDREWHGTTERVRHACGRTRGSQLTLLPFN